MTDDRRWAIAWHESAHTIAALEQGLQVEWVNIEGGYDEGINFQAAVKINDKLIVPERDAKAIAISMACPSFSPVGFGTPDPQLDFYAQQEAVAAYEMAGSYGYSMQEIVEEAEWIADWRVEEIHAFTIRLHEEGLVVFDPGHHSVHVKHLEHA
jgi:hypothetical protein